eukprot:5576412-Prymnesium_polylepis.1
MSIYNTRSPRCPLLRPQPRQQSEVRDQPCTAQAGRRVACAHRVEPGVQGLPRAGAEDPHRPRV